ncbi:YfgM family protein [Rodentibacter caecimuris]|uniref:Ancillary SecYEG translocon subunit n=1 Tax=Rodentibacter caecimuris TaxID=1796644 RepID=A0ABX3KZK4_9PAST|nr:hypothetical protein BKG89_02175 [Rodentibacter heylii]
MAYTIEEEQEINQLKEFWKEYGKTIIFSLILGGAGVFGWRYWQTHQLNQSMQTSAAYDELTNKIFNDDKARHVAVESFVQDNPKTGYAVFALLEQAKNQVSQSAYQEAENTLKSALQQSQNEILTSLIALRLSSVQFQLKQWDNALKSLEQVKLTSFDGRKYLLAGDIQEAKGDKQAARRSFEAAQKQGTSLEQQLALMKLNNL